MAQTTGRHRADSFEREEQPTTVVDEGPLLEDGADGCDRFEATQVPECRHLIARRIDARRVDPPRAGPLHGLAPSG
jgi:hypothetical protein